MKGLLCIRSEGLLRLYNDDRRVADYVCSVGMQGYETPEGAFELHNLTKHPDWWLPAEDWVPEDRQGDVVPGLIDGEPNPENPLKSRWLGVRGGVGIHGTDDTARLGLPVSHGCIRLSIPDVKELFELVREGTPIIID